MTTNETNADDGLLAACEAVFHAFAAAEWGTPEDAEYVLAAILKNHYQKLRAAIAKAKEAKP